MEYRRLGGSGLKVSALSFGAVGWKLTDEQLAKLDAASETMPIYPYWHQRQFAERNPPPTPSHRQ